MPGHILEDTEAATRGTGEVAGDDIISGAKVLCLYLFLQFYLYQACMKTELLSYPPNCQLSHQINKNLNKKKNLWCCNYYWHNSRF